MSKIHLLSEDIINKIAAGEVIERPASVLKELIENSLDAHATIINITLEDFGKKRIEIRDNGDGIEPDDAEQAVLRHATSKITTADDLTAITTFGFRGEALASIAAVSKLTLTTKTETQPTGIMMTLEGGKIITTQECAAEQGTTLLIENIFFNTPARKKFLKTDHVELRHCVDVVTHYALINNNVTFKLTHNQTVLIHSPALPHLLEKIASIYGAVTAKDLVLVHYSQEDITLTGYISTPYNARNYKNYQSLFVNGRWVRSEIISSAIYEGYHSLLFVNKHPIFVLNLTLNPKTIDVNVHPNKMEVKFEQNDHIHNIIKSGVRQALQQHNLIPTLSFAEKQQITLPTKQAKYTFEQSAQTTLQVREKSPEIYNLNPAPDIVKPTETKVVNTSPPQISKLPPLKILGQIHKTFFIAETPGGVVFIDQHAMHERVLYEQFMHQLLNKEIAIQHLLKPSILECSASETIILKQLQEELEQFGFTIETFGENTFLLKTIPSVFSRLQDATIIHDLLGIATEKKNKLLEVKEEIITRMACRAAVMAGEELTINQVSVILQDLEKTELPYTCPHGRPTIIKTTTDELEKKFRRK